MSDGAQSLDIQQFREMMRGLAPYMKLWKDARVTADTGAV